MSANDPGYPAYNFTDLLKIAGFASQPMLRDDRRQPAPDQKPIGQYWSGHAWVVLYKAADAVDMPPLSPGRQRQYDKARTCAGCGAKSKSPWSKFRDGERYCTPCTKPAAERLWRREREEDRPAIVAWARGVLEDPNVVLAAMDRHQLWTRDLVVDIDGPVLLDAEIRHNVGEPYEGHPQREELLTRSPMAVVDQIERLRGRRLIAWWPTTVPRLSVSFDKDRWVTERAVDLAEGDVLGRWYDRWVGELSDNGSYLSHRPGLRNHTPPGDNAEESIARMRDVLAEMASGHRPGDTGSSAGSDA